jgi:excisionase family DNA binding protein
LASHRSKGAVREWFAGGVSLSAVRLSPAYMIGMNAARKEKPIPDYLRELSEQLPITLDLKETAEVMKMHERSVQRLIASGELKATRSRLSGGSRLIITRSEVVRWFMSRDSRGAANSN